jgi:hypothetical protein
MITQLKKSSASHWYQAILLIVGVVFMAAVSQAQIVIKPVDATASSTYSPGVTPLNLINGSGLSFDLLTGDSVPVNYPTHDRSLVVENFWHSNFVVTPTITFDLGAAYDLIGFHSWNIQQNYGAASTDRGIQSTDIYGSLDGISFSFIANRVLAEAPWLDTYTGEDYALSSSNVRFVRFNVISNYGDSITGLGEMRFVGTASVPEPTTVLMLVIGLGSLAGLRMIKKSSQEPV